MALRLPGLLLRRPDKRSAIRRFYLRTALQQHRLNMADGARRVQSLRTYTDAVHDAMAAEYAESVTQSFQTTLGFGVAAIDQEAIGSQQTGRADKLVRVPPERRTGR